MEEARYGAVCPGTFLEVAHDSRQVLTLEAQKLLTFHVIYQHPEDAWYSPIKILLANWSQLGCGQKFGRSDQFGKTRNRG